ncbi:hypothetical protein ACFFTN_15500 [Aminobacter aganoensis]|uniref:Uncharacterized protein n=1 Tax=Aminobacter aganoensis TaxID=83264 RepID=A0A7X0FAR6_9HYPH|nr:hypothetical protein [Aminobacter aganoensis]MBB6356283.1 hypothetical protein [Aminobacter aganoensis]
MKLRQNAEAAGFNPLTALRAGGGAGFTTTHNPALASGDFIAQAIGGIGNAIASIDPMRDATAKLEHQIKQATLANIQADTASRLRASIGGVPVSTGARVVKASSPLASSKVGQPLPPTVEIPTLTNPYPMGTGRLVNPGFVDAEAWETRYGDIAQEFGGLINLGADYIYNSFQRTKREGEAAKATRDVAIERKRRARQELRKNDAFFKSHGY